MRAVYQTRAAYVDIDADAATADTIILPEPEPELVPTGLVNPQGVPLYRRRPTVPFGFHGRR